MATVNERISALEEKLKKERAKKAQIDARKKAADTKKARAEDTRKKVLVGAVILARVERGEWPADKLMSVMDKALTRADDRAIFGLTPIVATEEPKAPNL